MSNDASTSSLKESLIISRDDITIKFTGEQLDMGDSDVFLQAIRMMATQKQGDSNSLYLEISPYNFLKKIGRAGKGKKNKQWLINSFKRLTYANVLIQNHRFTVVLSLINEYIYDEQKNKHYLIFNERIVDLFKKDQYGLINWTKRKKIKIDLSKWLQTYIASNRKGTHAIKIEKIKAWCGQTKRRNDHFLKTLKKSMDELHELKIIRSFQIKEELLLYVK
jgi:hypothetical protein